MKYFILLSFLFVFGCTGSGLLEQIPNAEFKKFEYHRAGNMTSMHITAANAEKTPEGIMIESVKVQGDYGPFVNFNITLEGYIRLTTDSVINETIQLE